VPIACLEEIAYHNDLIGEDPLRAFARSMSETARNLCMLNRTVEALGRAISTPLGVRSIN